METVSWDWKLGTSSFMAGLQGVTRLAPAEARLLTGVDTFVYPEGLPPWWIHPGTVETARPKGKIVMPAVQRRHPSDPSKSAGHAGVLLPVLFLCDPCRSWVQVAHDNDVGAVRYASASRNGRAGTYQQLLRSQALGLPVDTIAATAQLTAARISS